MAILKNTSTNKTKEIKNLGWLLRNYAKVLCMEVLTDNNYDGCVLRALGNNFTYSCHFNSKSICINWIVSHRRIFADLRLSVDDSLYVISQHGLNELR
jgi:hypothetical protein